MADPFSIVANCAAVIGLCRGLCIGCEKLRDLYDASNALCAVNNEVSDLTLAVQDVKSIFQPVLHTSIQSQDSTSSTIEVLRRANSTLLELDIIINYRLLSPPDNVGKIKINRSAWVREKGGVQRLLERLRVTRQDLTLGVAAMNLTSSMRLEVSVQELSLVTEDIERSQQRASLETSYSLASHQTVLDQLLLHIYRLQEGQETTNQTLQDLANVAITHGGSRQPSDRNTTANQMGLEMSSNRTETEHGNQGIPLNTVSIKVRRLRGPSCLMCSCVCHLRQQLKTPPLLNQVMGSLFVGYTSVPVFTPRCNKAACKKNSDTSVTATYMFPRWFWYRFLSLMILYTRRDGLELNLRVYRVYKEYSPIFQYATQGNTPAIKALLRSGEASPFEIHSSSQTSPLFYAVRYLRLDICRILLYEGADPHLVGSGRSKRTPFNFAWDLILEKREDATTLQTLREIFQGDDGLQDRQFTTLHKIVLQMIHIDLQQYLISCPPSEIDQVDSDGRTALSWASAQGDLKTVTTLLASKANPNIISSVGKTALHYAAAGGNFAVIDQLIIYGVNIDARDVFSGMMALHTACLARSPPSCLRRLIEAGADIEARDEFGGGTALIFTCQSDNAEFTKILVESGANIESETFEEETAIFIATQYNSHQVMQVLLAQKANLVRYNTDGLSILHCLAENGDLQSLQMLTKAPMKGLRIDDEDSRGMTPSTLAERRKQETPEWHAAWTDLVASLDQEVPETPHYTRQAKQKEPSDPNALWALLNTMEVLLSEEAKQIHRYLIQLPRPPLAILRAATVIGVAITWLLLSQSKS